jgi:molybdopterin-guanine dinucleotide biosynthesis protein
MNSPGESDSMASRDLMVVARTVMLDALAALAEHRDAVIVIGAQAVYLRTASAPVALAESTKDSDLAIDTRMLGEDPRVEEAMRAAGFIPNPETGQPGAWVNPLGVPVDLMVPEALAGPGGPKSRGARVPPHDRKAMRRAKGLEAAVVDNSVEDVQAIDPADGRTFSVRVAGPAALLVAKIHKLAERIETPQRLNDKDAHDMYRILRTIETDVLVEGFQRLSEDHVSAETASEALAHLRDLVAAGPDAIISMMAGRAEQGLGEPETVSAATAILAADLLDALRLA